MSTSAPTTARQHRHLRRDMRQLRAMALGFGVGSVLFGTGAALAMAGAAGTVVAPIFALGAVLFTAAATVQLVTAWGHFPRAAPRPARRAVTDPDLASAGIQLVGTIAFNVMTIRALPMSGDAYAQVWRPDALGSALFLISSWIAWHPITRSRRHELIPERSLVICMANMVGSIFFAVSAAGAQLVGPEHLRNPLWDNVGTLLGAIGFLVGSALLWPGRESDHAGA